MTRSVREKPGARARASIPRRIGHGQLCGCAACTSRGWPWPRRPGGACGLRAGLSPHAAWGRLAPLLALAGFVSAAGCYADWDLPRCGSVGDCPLGYSRCYDGYCLATAVAGVDKAPLPDASAPAPDANEDTAPGDTGSDVPAGPDVATCTAAPDGCCDLALSDRSADPDCVAWVGPRPPALWVSRPVVDAARGLYHLTYGNAASGAMLLTASIGGLTEPRHLALGKEEARCPVLLDGGDVVVVGSEHVWSLPPEGETWRWLEPNPLDAAPDPPCPAVSQGRLLLVAGASVAALDVQTGDSQWEWTEPSGARLRAPAARGSTVVVCTDGGLLTRLDAVDAGGPEFHTVDLGATVTAGPIVGAGGDLLALGVTKLGSPALLRTVVDVRTLTEPEALLLDDAPLPGAEPIVTPGGELWLLHQDGRARFYPAAKPPLHATGTSPQGLTASAMALTEDGALLLSTTTGVAAIDGTGALLWRHDLPALEPLPPLPLPDARLLVIGTQTLYELRTTGSPLADGPWSTQRRDLGATAARP